MSKAMHPSTGLLPATDHPFTARKTVETLAATKGTIVSLDAVNMGIEMENSAPLLPINLPKRFQRKGLKIVFSGAVKETGLTEMTAGRPLVLTQIREL